MAVTGELLKVDERVNVIARGPVEVLRPNQAGHPGDSESFIAANAAD
jgi:hypothetical protein